MRENPVHEVDDAEIVKALIRESPWAILVSDAPSGLVASHYPILLDEESEELAIYTHVGRPDEVLDGLGERETLIIVQGVHGYVSPSWYAPGATRAPTWNFAVAHLHAVPQILDEEANLRTLARLVEHFERRVEHPMLLDHDWARPVAKGTVGVRFPVSHFECKIKMSQDKDPETQRRVVAALRQPGPYQHPALADAMEETFARNPRA